MGDFDTGKESSFNEAVLKMQRLHETQRLINILRINMLDYNYLWNKYNYQVVFENLKSLLLECSGKMSDAENLEGDRVKNIIEDLDEHQPIFQKINISSIAEQKTFKQFNNDNWKRLRKLLFDFEMFVRKMLEIHGLSSPNVQDEALWD